MPAVASQALLSHRRKQSPFVHPEALLREPPPHHGPAPRRSVAAGLIKLGLICHNFTLNDGPSLPPLMTQGLGS